MVSLFMREIFGCKDFHLLVEGIQREAHNGIIITFNTFYKQGSPVVLDAIPAGFIHGASGFNIPADFMIPGLSESDSRLFDKGAAFCAVSAIPISDKGHTCEHFVGPAPEEAEHLHGFFTAAGFLQYGIFKEYNGVGSNHQYLFFPPGHLPGFAKGELLHDIPGRFVMIKGFVNRTGLYPEGQVYLLKKLFSSRTF